METDERWLIQLLARIEARPGMYLGSEEVRDLCVYLAGYGTARQDLGLEASDRVLSEFTNWLRGRVDAGVMTSLGWPGLIEKTDASRSNVRTFFKQFEAFLLDADASLAAERAAWTARDTR